MVNKKSNIVIIDYEMSNLFSVLNACNYFGENAEVTSDKNIVMKADALILPGVGAFQNAMRNLHRLDLVEPIREFINSGKPFLGICLGLQLLFSESSEFGSSKGLGLIEGSVEKFEYLSNSISKIKVPHMGWNRINHGKSNKTNWEDSPLRGIKEGEYMYFVHSFYVVPEKDEDIITLTSYEGNIFCSGIMRNNVFATQFHPEKSGYSGIQIYSNWFKMINKKL